jgi:hypothetical protein
MAEIGKTAKILTLLQEELAEVKLSPDGAQGHLGL